MALYAGVLKKAIEVAEKSTFKYQLAAVVFKGKRIISYGENSIRSTRRVHNKYKNYETTLHAEQNALSLCNKEFTQGLSLLVIRLNKTGGLAHAEPCEMCMKMIKHYGIKYIYYSLYDGTITRKKV